MICAHCRLPLRGYATAHGEPLCHPNLGLDCYRLVTVYHHDLDCTDLLCRVSADMRLTRERNAVRLD